MAQRPDQFFDHTGIHDRKTISSGSLIVCRFGKPRLQSRIRVASQPTTSDRRKLFDYAVLHVEDVVASGDRRHAAGEAVVSRHINCAEDGAAFGTTREIARVDVIPNLGSVRRFGLDQRHRQKDRVFFSVCDRPACPGGGVFLANRGAGGYRKRGCCRIRRSVSALDSLGRPLSAAPTRTPMQIIHRPANTMLVDR
jgi:hypothetical protein